MLSHESGYEPTEEAIEYFRGVLERDLHRWEKAATKFEGDEKRGYEKALKMIQYYTLGDEQGCVVTAFDRRGPKIRARILPKTDA